MHYPAPDRSNRSPIFVQTGDNDALDIGWVEGVLSDGRPFRAECWCQDQLTMLTFFMSAVGLEEGSREQFADLLAREGLVQFGSDRRYVAPAKWVDPSGNEMWSVNVVVGDEDEVFVTGSVPLRSYARTRARERCRTIEGSAKRNVIYG